MITNLLSTIRSLDKYNLNYVSNALRHLCVELEQKNHCVVTHFPCADCRENEACKFICDLADMTDDELEIRAKVNKDDNVCKDKH